MQTVWTAIIRGAWKIEENQVRIQVSTSQEAASAAREIRSSGLMARWTECHSGYIVLILEDVKLAVRRMAENAPDPVMRTLETCG